MREHVHGIGFDLAEELGRREGVSVRLCAAEVGCWVITTEERVRERYVATLPGADVIEHLIAECVAAIQTPAERVAEHVGGSR